MEPLLNTDETNRTNSNFLKVSGLYPLIRSLRKIFGIDYDFPNLTYSIQKKNEIYQPELGESFTSNLLKTLSDSKEVNKKGSKSVLWINAKPGEHEGLISDSFMDFIIISQLSPELKRYLLYNGASKFYLLKGYKIGKQTGSLEPVFINPKSIRNSHWNELVRPEFHYHDISYKSQMLTIDYFIPKELIQHHIGEIGRPLDGGRRVNKAMLEKWDYIKLIKRKTFDITDRTRENLEQIQNIIFLEWWRGYFNQAYPIVEDCIFKQFDHLKFCPKEIILRAYIEVLVYKTPMYVEIPLQSLSKISDLNENYIKQLIKDWIIGNDYYGKECLENGIFIFPPKELDRFWAKPEIILMRYQDTLKLIGRKKELSSIQEFLSSHYQILSLTGDHGIGKTRLLIESSIENQEEWEFYWLFSNKKISWELIKEQIQKENRKLVLIIDDVDRIQNWELILEEFQQIELDVNQIKLIVVSGGCHLVEHFLINHYFYRNEELLKRIQLNPLNFKHINLKNEAVRILLEQGIDILQINSILDFSQGFIEVIEDELYFLKQENLRNLSSNGLSSITRFEERVYSLWNQSLSDDERNFLKILSVCVSINIHEAPVIKLEKEEYMNLIERLIVKDWVKILYNQIFFKRVAIMKWVVKSEWVKDKNKVRELSKLVDKLLELNPRYFLNALVILKDLLNYSDFKNILKKINNWKEVKSFEELSVQIQLIFRILPLFASNFFQNIKIQYDTPKSGKSFNDPYLKSDISQNFRNLVLKTKNIWLSYVNKEDSMKIYDTYNLLTEILLVIQDFDGIIELSDKVLNLLKEEKDLRKNLYSSILLKKLNAIVIKNPKNSEKFYQEAVKVAEFNALHKGIVYSFWGEFLFGKKNVPIKKILKIYFSASECFIQAGSQESYVYLWSGFTAFFINRYGKIEIYLKLEDENWLEKIKKKLKTAEKWAKDLRNVRAYVGLILNWRIFDPSGDVNEAIKELKECAKYAKENKHLYLTGDIYHQLGTEYFNIGEYEESVRQYELCIKYTKESEVIFRLEPTYSMMGDAFWRLRMFEDAIKAHKKAYKLNRQIRNFPEAQYSLNSIFDINIACGDIDKALALSDELIITSKKSNNSVFYYESLLRLSEANYLKGNYNKVYEYLDEVSGVSNKLEKDVNIHIKILRILNDYKKGRKEVLINELNDYLNNLHQYNFKINDFEITWIIRLIDILFEEEKLETLQKLSNIIKNIPFFKERPLSIYEYFLQNLNNYLSIFMEKLMGWPDWANYFLDLFEKPERFFFGRSNFIETIRNVDHPEKDLKIDHFIEELREIVSEAGIMSEETFFKYLVEIPNLYIMIVKNKIRTIEHIQVIFNFLQKMFEKYNESLEKIQNLNLELQDKEFNFLNIFMVVADGAQSLNDLDLTLEVYQFVDKKSIHKRTRSSTLRFLEFYEVLAERRGEKTLALEILHKIDSILESYGNDNDKISNEVKKLLINLSENFNEQVEREIINLQEDREDITIANKLMIKSLKIFLLIKKKKIIQANNEALIFIYNKNFENEQVALTWFIAEFIDRIYIQEELLDEEIDEKIIQKYIHFFETEDLSDISFMATYERAVISIFLKMNQNIKKQKKLIKSLETCLRALQILKFYNWDQLKAGYNQLLSNLTGVQIDLINKKDVQKSLELSKKILKISKENNMPKFELFTLEHLIIESMMLDDYKMVIDWCFQYLESSKRNESLKILDRNFVLNNPTNKQFLDYMGIDIADIHDEELIELTTLRVIETLKGEILNNATRLGPRDLAYLRDQLFIFIIQNLGFKLLRKGNKHILYSFWSYLLNSFHMLIINIYRESDFNDSYLYVEKIINNTKGVEEWESEIITLWQIFLNLIGDNKNTGFNDIVSNLIKIIPTELKEITEYNLEILRNAITNNSDPHVLYLNLNISELKILLEEFKEKKDINKTIEIIIEITKYLLLSKDFEKCKEYISEGKKISSENGRDKDLMVLFYFEGIIHYNLGSYLEALNTLKVVLENRGKVNPIDYVEVNLYIVDILIKQGKFTKDELDQFFQRLKLLFDDLDNDLKEDLFYIVLNQGFSKCDASFFKDLSTYFQENRNKLINQFSIKKTIFDEIIEITQIIRSLKQRDFNTFKKYLKTFLEKDLQEKFHFFLWSLLPIWLEALSKEERESLNKLTYPYVKEVFNILITSQNQQIKWKGIEEKKKVFEKHTSPLKSLFFILNSLIRDHPEFFK